MLERGPALHLCPSRFTEFSALKRQGAGAEADVGATLPYSKAREQHQTGMWTRRKEETRTLAPGVSANSSRSCLFIYSDTFDYSAFNFMTKLACINVQTMNFCFMVDQVFLKISL